MPRALVLGCCAKSHTSDSCAPTRLYSKNKTDAAHDRASCYKVGAMVQTRAPGITHPFHPLSYYIFYIFDLCAAAVVANRHTHTIYVYEITLCEATGRGRYKPLARKYKNWSINLAYCAMCIYVYICCEFAQVPYNIHFLKDAIHAARSAQQRVAKANKFAASQIYIDRLLRAIPYMYTEPHIPASEKGCEKWRI